MNKQVVYFIFLFCLLFSGAANHILAQAEKKKIEAIRISTPPKIDGILDDQCWENVPVASDFYQLVPYNGENASLDSEVKFVYDDQAIYVGAMLHEPNPDNIYTELSERDEIGQVDYFGVYFDCFNDYYTLF